MPKKTKTYYFELTENELDAVVFALDQILQAVESDVTLYKDPVFKQRAKHLTTSYTKLLGTALVNYAHKWNQDSKLQSK